MKCQALVALKTTKKIKLSSAAVVISALRVMVTGLPKLANIQTDFIAIFHKLNHYRSKCEFSKQQRDIFVLFSRKYTLTFHPKCSPYEIICMKVSLGDNLHDITKTRLFKYIENLTSKN